MVDTSVCVENLRSGNAALASDLGTGRVLAHSFAVGELARGTPRNRREVLDLVGRLQPGPRATHAEALAFLERRPLMRHGIGSIDVKLLASPAVAAPGWPVDPQQTPRGGYHRLNPACE